ncbi:hypothetical protein AB9P05_00310 [Roseivirga sp. BDSF3-8]|uniref:hypothetical protein n=1 Tax=Roseivirga sp. BDSF3-8 TaxID=3241598 RepID=UPI003531AFF9
MNKLKLLISGITLVMFSLMFVSETKTTTAKENARYEASYRYINGQVGNCFSERCFINICNSGDAEAVLKGDFPYTGGYYNFQLQQVGTDWVIVGWQTIQPCSIY